MKHTFAIHPRETESQFVKRALEKVKGLKIKPWGFRKNYSTIIIETE